MSNQVTLGATEEELLQHFRDEVIPKLIDYERTARQMLLEKNRPLIEDKVYRARATLKVARLLGAEEATKLLSTLRFGISSGLLHNLSIETVEQLLLQVQPAHLAQMDPFAAEEEKGALKPRDLGATGAGRLRRRQSRNLIGIGRERHVLLADSTHIMRGQCQRDFVPSHQNVRMVLDAFSRLRHAI